MVRQWLRYPWLAPFVSCQDAIAVARTDAISFRSALIAAAWMSEKLVFPGRSRRRADASPWRRAGDRHAARDRRPARARSHRRRGGLRLPARRARSRCPRGAAPRRAPRPAAPARARAHGRPPPRASPSRRGDVPPAPARARPPQRRARAAARARPSCRSRRSCPRRPLARASREPAGRSDQHHSPGRRDRRCSGLHRPRRPRCPRGARDREAKRSRCRSTISRHSCRSSWRP